MKVHNRRHFYNFKIIPQALSRLVDKKDKEEKLNSMMHQLYVPQPRTYMSFTPYDQNVQQILHHSMKKEAINIIQIRIIERPFITNFVFK